MPRAPAELIIIGTIHLSHNHNRRYTGDALRDILLALEPAAIAVELYSALLTPDGFIRDDVARDHSFPENAAANQAAAALRVKLLPFDREGRDEHYQQTRYHEREDRASARFEQWLAAAAERGPESLTVMIGSLLSEATNGQLYLDTHAPPEIINSPAYDSVVHIKHTLWDEILPTLMADDPAYRDAVGDLHFLRDEWRERNHIMADNIVAIAARFPGKRIAVLTGSEHRYMLRRILSREDDIALEEYWHILPPEQT